MRKIYALCKQVNYRGWTQVPHDRAPRYLKGDGVKGMSEASLCGVTQVPHVQAVTKSKPSSPSSKQIVSTMSSTKITIISLKGDYCVKGMSEVSLCGVCVEREGWRACWYI